MGDICSFCGFLANYRIDYKTAMNRVWFEGGDLGLFFVLPFGGRMSAFQHSKSYWIFDDKEYNTGKLKDWVVR